MTDFLFADTSALVKLYVAEAGAATMWRLAGELPIAVSELAWAELHATLARRQREGLAAPAAVAEVSARFEQHWDAFLVVDLAPTRARVRELVGRRVLRGADAVHLASALLLADEGLGIRFACSDQRLVDAARHEGLEAIDPLVS